MPEWNADLRARLAGLQLTPAREAEIVDVPLVTKNSSSVLKMRAALRSKNSVKQASSLSGCGHCHKRTRRHRSSKDKRVDARCTGSGKIFATPAGR